MNRIRRFFAAMEPHHYGFIAVNFAVACGGVFLGGWFAYLAGACS